MQLALLQVAQHLTNSGRLGHLCPDSWPWVLGEVTHLRGTPTCRREGLGKAGAMRLAAKGEWVFLPPRRAGWHMGSSLVPPRDPQAQTPFPSPPGAHRMDFYRGARAPRGLRRALVCAPGEDQQRADLSSTPLAESRSSVWQALGDSQRVFFKGAKRGKRRSGAAEKRWFFDARGGVRAIRSRQAGSVERVEPQYRPFSHLPCVSEDPWMASTGALNEEVELFAWRWSFLCACRAKGWL